MIHGANYVIGVEEEMTQMFWDIFLAHPDSVKFLNIFPTVSVMDITYKTNKYRQTMFEIIRVGSNELIFVIAFVYMES